MCVLLPAAAAGAAALTSLVEVSLVNNPITRKQGYRAMLIAKCPRLYMADGQVRLCVCVCGCDASTVQATALLA